MEVQFQVPKIFLELQEVQKEDGNLEQSRIMLQNVMNKCNTYEDVLRMEKEGLISLEGLLEIIKNYEEVIGISENGSELFDLIRAGLENAPRARKRLRKAI